MVNFTFIYSVSLSGTWCYPDPGNFAWGMFTNRCQLVVFQIQKHFSAFPKSQAGISLILFSYRGLKQHQSFPHVWMQAELTGNCPPHLPGPSVGILPENHKERTLWNKYGDNKAKTFQGLGQTRGLF